MMLMVDVSVNSDKLVAQYEAICKAEKEEAVNAPDFKAAKEIIEDELMMRQADELHDEWLNEYLEKQDSTNLKKVNAPSFRGYFIQKQKNVKSAIA